MAQLIDGRAIAEKVYLDLRREIAELKARGVTPGLAVVLVGETRRRAPTCGRRTRCAWNSACIR